MLNKSLINKCESLKCEPSFTKDYIPREEIETKILERFPQLKDDRVLHNYFCSYDFHENENDMVDLWKEVVIFLFQNIYHSFALKIVDILDSSKIKSKRPLGLPNIIQELLNRGDFILSQDLKGDEYYLKNYPQFYKLSWGAWVKNGIGGMLYGSKKNQSVTFKPDDVLINLKLFHSHSENIIALLSKILFEEDIEVITIHELKNILRSSNLRFQDSYLDICLHFLQKTKKIGSFKVKVENSEIECIKVFRDENSTVTEKDHAIINILVQLKKMDKKIEEMLAIIQDCVEKAKECMKKKSRETALNCMRRKHVYQKAYQHFANIKFTLEQNLLDLKSMESNQNVKQLLEDVIKATKAMKLNTDDLEVMTDELKDKKDNLKEANDVFKMYNNDNVEDASIDMELENMINEVKEEELKKPQQKVPDIVILDDLKQPSKFDKSLLDFPKARENIHPNQEMDESLDKILEELKK